MYSITKSLIITIFLLLYLNCEGSKENNILPFNKESLSDIENNDLMKTPNTVSSQNPIIGFFNNKKNIGDKDYYKVYFALKEISYKIIQTAVPCIDSKISLFSPSGNILFYVDSGKKGEAEKIWNYYPNYEYIIMRIESKIGHNEKVPYIINFIPKTNENIDETEPNNSKENAILIKYEETKKGLISPKNDVDYYKIIFDNNKNHDFSINLETLSNLDLSLCFDK